MAACPQPRVRSLAASGFCSVTRSQCWVTICSRTDLTLFFSPLLPPNASATPSNHFHSFPRAMIGLQLLQKTE